VSEARILQDSTIQTSFLAPWRNTLTNSVDVAMKARAAVRTSRLELDSAKQMYVAVDVLRRTRLATIHDFRYWC
jgi:hypothetical protein